MSHQSIYQKHWNIRGLIWCHLSIAFLLITFISPVTHGYWEKLDLAFFRFWNGSLEDSPLWQIFWALSNHHIADWLEDIVFIGFFIAYIRKLPAGTRLRGISQLIFCAVFIAFIILFVNRHIFRDWIVIYRDSPTRVVDSSIFLSDHVTWISSIKDHSNKSFPADHATTAILFACIYSYFAGWRLGLIAVCYTIYLCLPRMVAGAHWLTDAVVGSGSIVLFFFSWAFCTPLQQWIVDKITAILTAIRRRFTRGKIGSIQKTD